MDQNITLASILSDWLQTAIDNTLYSAVLVTLTAITFGLVGFLGGRNRLTRLNAQLAQEKSAREQSAKERDELLSVQQQDAERIAAFEQQLEQLSSRLQESEQQQSQILVEKKAEITELQATLNGKTELIDKLKTELEENIAQEQSAKERDELLSVQQQDAERIAAFEQQLEQLSSRLQESEQLQSQQKQAEQQQSQILAEKKAEITELQTALKDKTELFEKLQTEQESSQFADELNIVKQQLQQMEVALNVKNEQIEQFERASQSVANDKDRITELETQIEKLNSSRESEAMQDQVAKL